MPPPGPEQHLHHPQKQADAAGVRFSFAGPELAAGVASRL
jgi:hypothetical protein